MLSAWVGLPAEQERTGEIHPVDELHSRIIRMTGHTGDVLPRKLMRAIAHSDYSPMKGGLCLQKNSPTSRFCLITGYNIH